MNKVVKASHHGSFQKSAGAAWSSWVEKRWFNRLRSRQEAPEFQQSSFDDKVFRETLSHYPTGVAVITAETEGDGPVGMVVGSFTAVSLRPPLVAFFCVHCKKMRRNPAPKFRRLRFPSWRRRCRSCQSGPLPRRKWHRTRQACTHRP
ncbi:MULTISPECIES: flavin reductase family protein [unclassified Sinorhizobium]|uniref:flavin reductase family protein n=1 Tax=unclassified Sinorhizobium TaxID=2613772 RepID=UPI003014F53E